MKHKKKSCSNFPNKDWLDFIAESRKMWENLATKHVPKDYPERPLDQSEPHIVWVCQSCGREWCRTIASNLYIMGIGDPTCTCAAGSTMNSEPLCSVCGQSLGWGDSICKHILPYLVAEDL